MTQQALSDATLIASGLGIEHHFGGGAYIKQTELPAGTKLGQHAHKHDHLSVLVSGSVGLTVDGVLRCIEGFQIITLEAGKQHQIEAFTDAVWLCVWATEETDSQLVDASILRE